MFTHRLRHRADRAGFTLVEMILVVSIILVLMSLLLPAINRVRKVGDLARASAELRGIQIACTNFQNATGNSPLVSISSSTTYTGGKFRLATSYIDPATGQPLQEWCVVLDGNGNPVIDPATGQPKKVVRNWPEIDFLMQTFPRMSLNDNGLRVKFTSGIPYGDSTATGQPVLSSQPILLDANQALMFWLTGGTPLNFLGFSTNPAAPLAPLAPPSSGHYSEDRKGPFMEVLMSRFTAASGVVDGRFRDPWGTPYAVFGSARHARGYPDVTYFDPNDTAGINPVKAYYTATGVVNPTGVQIISAGPDRRFGPGSASRYSSANWYAPEVGPWAGTPGADDVGSWKQYQLGVVE